MKEIARIFAKRVKELRQARGLNQDDYAYFIGVNYTTISSIEGAKHSTKFDIIDKIIKAENIPAYKLFLTDEEKDENCDREIARLSSKLNAADKLTIINLLKTMTKE